MSIDMENVKKLIRENPRTIHTIVDIAQQLGCGIETLRKEFWRKERTTLGEYMLHAKIEKAKRMLIETDLPCKEICFEVGFGREDSGAKTFRRKVGMTMDGYRAMSRDGTTLERIRDHQKSVIPEKSIVLGNQNGQPKKSTRNGNR